MTGRGKRVERRAQIGVECPQCHWRQFLEVEIEESLLKSPLRKEIQNHLEAWMSSRCPNHLGLIGEMSKN
jgi:hypothetical protein